MGGLKLFSISLQKLGEHHGQQFSLLKKKKYKVI